MVKKIYINDKEIFLDEDFSSRERNGHSFGPNDERHKRHHNDQFSKYPRRPAPRIVETRLFTSKDKLVEYVNEKGQSDALIDIYKIEEELYKLVIKR